MEEKGRRGRVAGRDDMNGTMVFIDVLPLSCCALFFIDGDAAERSPMRVARMICNAGSACGAKLVERRRRRVDTICSAFVIRCHQV